MSRFLGKYSFFHGDRILVYYGYRAGLISVGRTTIFDAEGKEQPLPPEASKFLAYDSGGGEFTLRAYNGEVVSFGGGEMESEISTVSTMPTGNPRYREYFAPARFLLAPLRNARAAGSFNTALHYQVKSRRRGDVGGFLIPSPLNADRRHEYDAMRGTIATNVERGEMFVWQFEQYADGVDEILSAKKVRLIDFTPVGKAVVDVSGETFDKIDLGNADFRGANFSNTTLSNCTARGARFEKANFNGAKIAGGDYTFIEFSDTTMQGTVIDNVGGLGCNFTRVDMRTVQASVPIGIKSTEQYRTRFTQGKIHIGLIGKTSWNTLMLDDTEIEGVEQITEGETFTANNANLSRANLSKLTCRFADFSNSEMYGTVFSSAKIPGAKFLSAKLDGAVFSSAELPEAKFTNAHLSEANFSGARLDQADFDGATLLDVDFSNAYLESVSFKGIEQKQASGAAFNRAFLLNCDLTGVDLATVKGKRRASLVEAYLHGANLTGAQLAGTNLTSAGIPTEAGELTVKLPDLPPLAVSYEPTIIDPSRSTNPETVCPNGTNGPCEGDKLKPKVPFPDVWPWPRRAVDEGD